MASPRCPVAATIGVIQRGGRPVTNTSTAPASSTNASAARVRSETVPSERTSVPSRSVATSRGYGDELTVPVSPAAPPGAQSQGTVSQPAPAPCLLYTSDAADEEDSVDLGGRR